MHAKPRNAIYVYCDKQLNNIDYSPPPNVNMLEDYYYMFNNVLLYVYYIVLSVMWLNWLKHASPGQKHVSELFPFKEQIH